jgi:hypothetical protein
MDAHDRLKLASLIGFTGPTAAEFAPDLFPGDSNVLLDELLARGWTVLIQRAASWHWCALEHPEHSPLKAKAKTRIEALAKAALKVCE